MHIPLSDHFTTGKLIRFTLPSIAMMIFTSIYMIVDGYFVSNFAGKTPFAAVNLVMPVIMILGTVGFVFGNGGTALVSMTYGTGDKEMANRYFSLLVYVAAAVGVALTVLGIIFIRPVCIALGAQGALLENCVLYARINLLSLPFFILQLMFQNFFVAAEKPQLGLWVTLIAGGANIVLDAILVPILPQEQKLAGAAIATAAAQTLGGLLPLLYFLRKNSSILQMGRTRWYGNALARACFNGSSEFMSNISMNLVGILYNLQLMRYAGENGVAAYGVMMYVSMVFSSTFIGYAIGVAPVIGFHFGAQNHRELKSLLRKSLYLIGTIGIAMVISAQLLAVPISRLFVGYDAQLLALTVSGFRIYGLCFAFMGFGMFVSCFFTALNDGLTSALMAFIRTLVLQSAAVLLLPLLWQINGVWISVVVAEFMSLVLGSFFLVLKRAKYHY